MTATEWTRDVGKPGNGRNAWHARWRALAACDRGISAVEFGLIMPFLLVLLLGLMDFGAAGIHRMQMANSVRAGLQYAMVRRPVEGDLSGIEAAVDKAAPEAEGPRTRTVTLYCQCPDGTAAACTATCATGDRSSYVSIVMQEQYRMILGLPFADNRITMRTEGAVQLN